MLARYFILGACCALIFLGVLVGLGFLIAAAYAGLTEVVEEAWAMLIVGTALIILCSIDALVIWLVVRGAGSRGRGGGTTGGGAPGAGQSKTQVAQALAEKLLSTVERHPKEASIAALGLGLALGVSPALRRYLARLVD